MIVYFETLGCSRNQVDSEIMLGKLTAAGHTVTRDPMLAQVIVINTCGFISTASDEAVDLILQMARLKQAGACERLIAAGCLAQRYKDDPDLVKTLPEVDAFLGTGACDRIVDAVEGRPGQTLTLFPDPAKRGFQKASEKRERTTGPFSYIKVSEGCDRKCTFCIIPVLRGPQRSRPVDAICKEAETLVSDGVKEIILTAENTTDYGRDLDNGTGFHTVLETLGKSLSGTDAWIRFLYTHPGTLTPEIIRAVTRHNHICSYYDVPIQHASSAVLKRMGRPYTKDDLVAVFKTIREIDPDAVLRTTLIVGFPGETEADFTELLAFIKEVRFNHLGVFTYSDSEDLKSHRMKDHVDAETAEHRHDLIMAAQAEISESINETYVGNSYTVLVEENPEPGLYIGRTFFQAPEVDGVTFIYADDLELNTFVKVKITDAFEYDIAGERV